MKQLYLLLLTILTFHFCFSQQPLAKPCATDPVYRAFDFWLGDWDVYGPKGKAGDSKIEMILDSCIILENWKSAGSAYAGKSFNTYNAATKQWQQTWVDNVGGSTEFLRGKADAEKITFWADKIPGKDGKSFDRRLTFYKLDENKVRQHGERSDDGGKTWTTEYDLEYRRKM